LPGGEDIVDISIGELGNISDISRGNAPYFLIKTNEDFKIIYISAKLDRYINKINHFFIKR
jgi:hypothetical protein